MNQKGFIKILFIIIILIGVLGAVVFKRKLSEQTVQAPSPSTPTSELGAEVRVIASEPCGGAHCYLLGVTCQGLAERRAKIREIGPQNPIGTVVFTTGGFGTGFYSETASGQPITNTYAGSELSRWTVKKVLDAGYQMFELAWDGESGWGTGVAGAGYKKAMCGSAEVMRWIAAHQAKNPKIMCAHGGSGGAFQIAYGLSVYGLKDLLDMVVLAGGPPTSRVDVVCSGTDDPKLKPAVWPDGIGGFQITDEIMGWKGNGYYCKKRSTLPYVIKALQDTSLVSPTGPRDYSFPHTKVNFVNSDDETHADEQGRIYYQAIATSKAWYDVPGTLHAITEESAKKVTELIINECGAQ